MALTAQEQAELNSLNQRVAIQQSRPTRLTEQETDELQSLNQRAAEAQARGLQIPQQSFRQPVDANIISKRLQAVIQSQQTPIIGGKRAGQLLSQLGGQLPATGALPSLPQPTTELGINVSLALQTRREEQQRRTAFAELQKAGFSKEKIGEALAFEAGTKPLSTLARTAGATIAGLAALGVGALIPGPEELFTVPGAIKAGAEIVSAGLGGAIGAGLQAAADPDIEFTFGEFLRVFGEEATLEGLSVGGVGVARVLLGGAKKTLIPGIQQLSIQLAGAGKRAGVKGRRVITRGFTRAQMRFLPATFSQNQIVDTLQGIGEGSLVGSNTIFQFKRGIRKSVVQLQKELVENFTKGAEKQGTLAASTVLFDTLKGNRTAWSKAGGMLYRTLDDEGVEVSMRGLKKFTKGQWDLILETGEIAGDPKLNTIFRRAGTKLPPSASFEAGHFLRSKLLSIERAAKKGAVPKPQTAKIARDMINEITSSMEIAAKTRPGLFKQYRQAADFWRAGSKKFDNDIVRGLTRKLRNHPQLAALAVFHPNTAQEIKLVREAVGEKAFKEMRGAWLEQLLKDSASKEVGEEGVLMGTNFLNKFSNMGDETLTAIFTKKEIGTIEDLAKIAAFVQQKTGGVGGSLKILQGVAVFGLVAAPLLPEGQFRNITGTTAGMILLGPAVVARMMTNPVSARLLSEGFKVRAGTSQGVALVARLVREVLKTRAQINQERQERVRQLLREETRIKTEQLIETGQIRTTPTIQQTARRFPRL